MVPVPRQWLTARHPGDVLLLHDARGSKRALVLEAVDEPASGGFVMTAHKTTYLETGTVLRAQHGGEPTEVGPLPETEQSLVLRAGHLLQLTRDCSPAPVGGNQAIARIGCTLPEAFDHALEGDAVHFDDGKIGGRVVSVDRDDLTVRIDHPEQGEARLKAGKGINMPDTDLPISAITDRDVVDLSAVVELADMVDMSFVRTPSDVERLLDELDRLGGDHLGIVLKIETRRAFEHLPQLLLTAMRRPRVGAMIARGDLAVECGYERMAELQEEILWLCEAAHLPVIWATQVLEQLAKTGLPSRAEISDAAMSERAECVMLNKGPYLDDAVTVLDNIMRRWGSITTRRTRCCVRCALGQWRGARASTMIRVVVSARRREYDCASERIGYTTPPTMASAADSAVASSIPSARSRVRTLSCSGKLNPARNLAAVSACSMQATVKVRSIAEPRGVVRVAASLRTHPTRSAARSSVWFTDARILSASSSITSATRAGRLGHQR